MTDFKNLISGAGSFFVSAGLIVLVIVVLSILHRLLTRADAPAGGRKFRNQLIMFGTSLLGVLVVILLLPIDATTRGNLLSLVGIILSATIALSSSTFLGNAMAGIMLKSVRNFRSGDFIKTGEHFGRVTERGLFHTEIQTADRDLTTLPNLVLATNPVTVVRQSGTIVGATVSLGYDVPRTQIEKQLLQAAQTAGLTEPFVQVLELGDYSVLYRVAGLLVETKQLITYRSRLRAAMLDCLHEAKVEIVSPAFINTRAYATDDTFIPAVTSRRTTVPDGAPVDVVFDKAEEAESLSQDRKVCDDLQLELKDARQELKDAPDDASKARAERRIARLDRQIAYLTERIAASEAREREHDE